MGALTSESIETTGAEYLTLDEGNYTVQESNEVEVDVAIGKSKSTKIKKAITHESVHCNIMLKCVEKMKVMNLPFIQNRRNKRMAREQVAMCDFIYSNIINTRSDRS